MAITIPINESSFLQKALKKRTPLSLTFELTERCNNNCTHCYINYPVNDKQAITDELSTIEIKEIVDQAVSMGTLWVLLTGGEPLLRDDFFDIYTYMIKKGLLVSVFTNATLITREHIDLFKKYPPKSIEVTVYGISEKTFAKVTRTNNFSLFMNGLDRLLTESIPVSLKSTILRSNHLELEKIALFCKSRTKNEFRFDPLLTHRLDGDGGRNNQIDAERLTAEEIIRLEKNDLIRLTTLEKACAQIDENGTVKRETGFLLQCNAGINSCCISSKGLFKLCTSLIDQNTVYDLKKGSFSDAWVNFVPRVRNMKPSGDTDKGDCGKCNLLHFCMWCPAHGYLETGNLEGFVSYFCDVAKDRYFEYSKCKDKY